MIEAAILLALNSTNSGSYPTPIHTPDNVTHI